MEFEEVEISIQAAKRLPEIPFVLAGDVHPIPKWAIDHPENIQVILRNGQFPQDLRVDIYSKASCVVYPAYNEDYGIVPVEAMSAGKPCIACTDGGGVLETVIDGETGLIVDPSVEALVQAIKYLHSKGEKMKERCIERAREFSWDKCLSELGYEIDMVLQ